MKKLYYRLLGENLEFQERIFRTIILVGSVVSVFVVVQALMLANADDILLPLLVLILSMGIAVLLTFKYHKMNLAAMILGFNIIVFVFPPFFFISGGVESGTLSWFSLGIFYIFLMFSGKKLAVFLTIAILTDAATYLIAYHYPELVIPLASRAAVYSDCLFAIFGVGITGGVILKFQVHLFEQERAVTLEQKEEIEKISASRTEFFTNMSHELRTPINTIIGLNEMILRTDCSEEVRENAANVHIASKHLLNLVNDILDLSKIEMKKMEIIHTEYHTKELFGELIDLMQVRMYEKNLQFVVNIDEHMPSVLFGDEKRIKQIVLNILSNAVKYTEEGSVTLSAQCEPAEEGFAFMKISVKDTGIGIRKEDLQHLYDAFKRVDAKKNLKVEGSGLGLSITKQLVDLMGGEITIDSIYTKGSTFTIVLKQEVIDASPVGSVVFTKIKKGRSGIYYEQSFEAPEARILIVDDNKMNLVVARKLLTATKVQVDTAQSGEECLVKTKTKYYNVILMDYMMPQMDGVETLNAIRNQKNGLCKDVPVIALTANIGPDAKKMYEDYGFCGYVEKPIVGVLLEQEILRCLPDDIVEYRAIQEDDEAENSEISTVANLKRKKIYITTDGVCSIPEKLMEEQDIFFVYQYIRTNKGRFRDTKEIDGNNLADYLHDDEHMAKTESASVEEYESFFADKLMEAEKILHISIGKTLSNSYENASAAAACFDHVKVLDSANTSAVTGLLVWCAAIMVKKGRTISEIYEYLDKIKGNIKSSFLLPDIHTFYQNGKVNRITARIFSALQLHPIVKVSSKSGLYIAGAEIGNIEDARKRYLQFHLWHRWKINTDIIWVIHAGCSVREQQMIRNEIAKYRNFKEIVFLQASVTNACNLGIGTIGIAYFTKNILEEG